MSRYEFLESRLRRVESGRGTQCVLIELADGSKRAFNLSRSDRATLLVSAFNLELCERDPETELTANPRAVEIINFIRSATRISPPSRFWATLGFRGGKNNAET